MTEDKSTSDANKTSQEHVPVERTEGFFEDKDATTSSQNVKIRLYFDKLKYNYFVYFKKINSFGNDINPDLEDTYIAVPGSEIRFLKENIEQLMSEVEKTPYDELPERLKTEAGKITHKDDHEYWSEGLALSVPSKSIYCRYYKEKQSSSWFLRFWQPRSKFSSKNPQWVGRTFSLPLGLGKKLVDVLENYENKIKVDDVKRLKMDV